MSDVAAGEFSVHPYNIYKPDDPSNVWWLVPKSDPTGPWFKYGKLFFTTDPKVIPFPDSLYSGFYVEKGLSPKLASHFSSYPEWIMGSDWLWGSFITALPTLRLGEGEIILVSAGLRVTDTRHMWDPSRLWFRGSANGSLKLIGSHPSTPLRQRSLNSALCWASYRKISTGPGLISASDRQAPRIKSRHLQRCGTII